MTDAKELPGFEERYAELKGVRMRYFVGGNGDPIVLVHGLAGGAANWVALAPLLARRRRVIVPELPGHGGSSALPAAPTLNAYADRVLLAAEREGLLPAPVVGHSMGGVVALRMAIRRPDAVRALILVGAAGISSATRRARVAVAILGVMKPARLVSPFRGVVARTPWLRYPVFARWEVADPPALSPAAVHGFLGPPRLHTDTNSAARALVADDPRTDLDRVRCPALVVWGARDQLVYLEDGVEYARRLRAPLRVIADAAHLTIGERPEACCDAIESFLDEVAGRPAAADVAAPARAIPA